MAPPAVMMMPMMMMPPNLSDVTVSGVARYPGGKRRHRSRLRNPRHGRESQSSDHGHKRDSNHVVLLGRQLMSPSNQYTCIVAVPRRRTCLFNEQTVRFHLRKFSQYEQTVSLRSKSTKPPSAAKLVVMHNPAWTGPVSPRFVARSEPN